jgi:hypothetical protein
MMLLALFMGISSLLTSAQAMDVTFLTQQGPLVLKTWTDADLKKLAKSSGEISAQKLIFDESTQNLDLNDRADVDLVIISGEDHTARIPRFMVWRGSIKLKVNRDGTLSSKGETSRLLVPSSLFTVSKIKKIELTRSSFMYPETELHLRTNPAASRGEKLFTQSCLACHSLPNFPKLKVEELTDAQLDHFNEKHRKQGGIVLDAKAQRGLVAYRDALSSEHSEVKSKK